MGPRSRSWASPQQGASSPMCLAVRQAGDRGTEQGDGRPRNRPGPWPARHCGASVRTALHRPPAHRPRCPPPRWQRIVPRSSPRASRPVEKGLPQAGLRGRARRAAPRARFAGAAAVHGRGQQAEVQETGGHRRPFTTTARFVADRGAGHQQACPCPAGCVSPAFGIHVRELPARHGPAAHGRAGRRPGQGVQVGHVALRAGVHALHRSAREQPAHEFHLPFQQGRAPRPRSTFAHMGRVGQLAQHPPPCATGPWRVPPAILGGASRGPVSRSQQVQDLGVTRACSCTTRRLGGSGRSACSTNG